MTNAYIRSTRIRLICSFLNNGGGTFEAMLNWVNTRLEKMDLQAIKQRSLEQHLKQLREGDFEHSKSGLPARKKAKLFMIEIFDRNKYRWADNTEKPVFGDLEDDERFTVPFLKGILKRYESIPAVQKIMDKIPEIFNIGEDEMETSAAVVHTGPELYHEINENFQEDLIKCVVQMLTHLHNEEVVEFYYHDVNKIGQNTYRVAPLQIRFYENYYYLVAYFYEEARVKPFRIDHIKNLKVDLALDDKDEVLKFSYKGLEKKTKWKDLLKNSLGIWIHGISDTLHEVEVQFTKWAASYMRHLKFHPSQKTLKDDEKKNELVLQFKIKLSKSTDSQQEPESRNVELSFLLKRFREDAKVISCKAI